MSKVGARLTNLLLPPPTHCYDDGQRGKNYHKPIAIGWNLYRCNTCASRREPERWWHKVLFKLSFGKYNPFGQ